MMDVLLLLSAGLASYGGFAFLALAMPEHRARAGAAPDGHAGHARLCGAILLCAAALLCVWRDGPSFGTMLWVLLMSAGGIAIALTLAWRPRALRYFVWPAARPRHTVSTAHQLIYPINH